MIGCGKSVKYNKIVNPIIFFAPLLLAQWIIIRIGVLDNYFTPNALQDDDSIILNYFSSAANYIGVLGIIPELLLIGELLLGLIIDWIYWGFIEKRRRLLINETSAASIIEQWFPKIFHFCNYIASNICCFFVKISIKIYLKTRNI